MSANFNNNLVPWATMVPPQWKVHRLGMVADIFPSNVDKHTIEDEQSIRLCNYTDVYKNDRITSSIEFMKASALPREIEKFQIRKGDVLATKDSESPDDIAISSLIAEDLPGVLCGYHLALIRPDSRKICGPFLSWVQASKSIRAQYEAKAVGVTRYALSQSTLKDALIPVPPLPDQRHIAAYLDEQTAKIDRLMDMRRRQMELLKAQRAAFIQQAVTRGINSNAPMKDSGITWLGKIPAHWKLIKLKYIARFKSGDSITSEKIDEIGEYPVFGGNGIRGYTNAYTHEGSYVLIGRQGALCGNINYAEGKFWASEHAVVATLFSGNEVVWFGELLKVMNLNQYSQSAAQPGLAVEKIQNLIAPVPSLLEQTAFTKYIEYESLRIESILLAYAHQLTLLAEYRASLINECVTGQRLVDDASPAKGLSL